MLADSVLKTFNENGVEIDNHFDLDQVLIKIDTGRRLKKLVRRSESVYSF